MASSSTYAYVGSFSMPNPPEHEGLHVFRVDEKSGVLTPIAKHVRGLNVGTIFHDSKRGVLYVADEVASTTEFRQQYGSAGGGGGRIYAFSIHSATGDLTRIGQWPSYGTQPAGIALDASGNFLIVSHFTSRATTTTIVGDSRLGYRVEPRYDDATTVLFPIDEAGNLSDPCDIHVHPASGLTPPSCLHSVTLSREGSFLVECDMNKDQLITYELDCKAQSLHVQSIHKTPPGSGPRYCAFHPTHSVFYVNYEHQPTVESFSYSNGGVIQSIGTVDVLPDNFEGGPGVLLSDLRIHPSGRYVYTLVRGHNLVSVFAVNDTTGHLRLVQSVLLKGISPKGCASSADGKFLYIAMSVSNEVQVWKINDDGLLTLTGQTVTVPRPSAMAVVNLCPQPAGYPELLNVE
ncbi:isomerase YbhE [Penicillium angulare]|uniref:Isomerase YbhE n=1 Tax=Penicillium angulare TaxID=116970 RepID=A0A9W9FU24_9EURO|nr:isomerase YbhE [Penicillium angulare]